DSTDPTNSNKATHSITEVEGVDRVVNATELADGKITVKGIVSNLSAGDQIDNVVVTLTFGTETRSITV
ncbi:hypothetical protein, partial [Acinetobacter sp. WCHAc060025]|uniref:hypothetical protein n=1 Tax=Acinetobacter sp. WCHAc060025 TaxID=2518625 RepID=UPI0013EEAE8F